MTSSRPFPGTERAVFPRSTGWRVRRSRPQDPARGGRRRRHDRDDRPCAGGPCAGVHSQGAVASHDHPVLQAGQRQPLPGLVLQVGEQAVIPGITQAEGDLVNAGERVVPLRPGLHLDAGEARAAQQRRPVDAGPGLLAVGNRRALSAASWSGPGACAGRRILRASAAAAAGSAAKWNASIEVAASAAAAGSPVRVRSPMTNRARLAKPEQCGPARGLLDRDRREVHPHQQQGIRLPGQPQSRPAAPAPQIGERLARRELGGLQHMAQQAGRDEGKRLNLGRQGPVRPSSPDPPDLRAKQMPRRLVKVGGGRRWRAGWRWGCWLRLASLHLRGANGPVTPACHPAARIGQGL